MLFRRILPLLALLLVSPVLAGNQARPDEAQRGLLRDSLKESLGFADRFDAEVWLVDMSGRLAKRLPDLEERLRVLKTVHREARRVGLNPELVLGLIETESNFDKYAISNAGALGLMQVMPFWVEDIGHPDDNLLDAETNLRYGCAILSLYLQIERGNLQNALARYNGTLGQSWYPTRVLGAWQKHWYVHAD
ncbi:MAG: lytic transglycosylase domain-containing protein [Gammaproteobacteria bacterium]|nr:lytic transglycosylase domain-containing protein [Gammaproteobacteria bacterium]